MHFTREPTIETIITPKEGFKLILRSVSGSGSEEFFVDMIEVITFGSSCFYRSLDKPKCFVIPAADYEVIEVRETRMVLKSASVEKDIKIAGGKESKKDDSGDKKKRRPKKRKDKAAVEQEEVYVASVPKDKPEIVKPTLIPPPSTLISDDIARYKEMTAIEELTLENTTATSASKAEVVENDQVLS